MRRSAGQGRGIIAAALLGATLLLASCGGREPWATEDPKEALTTFIAAVYAQRGEVAFAMLTPEAQAEVERRASAMNKAAGSEVVTPPSLLTSAGFPGPHHIARIEREAESEGAATYAVRTHDEREFKVRLERVESIWRVDIGALPAAATPAEASP